jgi:hypothetical protein
MKQRVERRTVDLSAYPDLVVIYLGMRVNRLSGLRQLVKIGPQIQRSVDARPDGLLLHENLLWGLFPLHVGMRQYWRDFESLESWARTLPHQRWWQDFLRDSGGTGFWHETYFRGGGFEAIYDDLSSLSGPPGLARFAPTVPAQGRMFSARDRLFQPAAGPAEGSSGGSSDSS